MRLVKPLEYAEVHKNVDKFMLTYIQVQSRLDKSAM